MCAGISVCSLSQSSSFKNAFIFNLDSSSLSILSLLRTYFTKIYTFSVSPFNTSILISTIQFLQDEVVLFTICMTLWLSQKSIILLLANLWIQFSMVATSANNSKYSILGCFSLMKPWGHCLYIQDFSQIPPKPKSNALEASDVILISVALIDLWKLVKLLAYTDGCSMNSPHINKSPLISWFILMWWWGHNVEFAVYAYYLLVNAWPGMMLSPKKLRKPQISWRCFMVILPPFLLKAPLISLLAFSIFSCGSITSYSTVSINIPKKVICVHALIILSIDTGKLILQHRSRNVSIWALDMAFNKATNRKSSK